MQPVRREKQVLSSQKTRAPECGYSELSSCFMQKRFKHQWRTPDSGTWSERAPRKEACRGRRGPKHRLSSPPACLPPLPFFPLLFLMEIKKIAEQAGGTATWKHREARWLFRRSWAPAEGGVGCRDPPTGGRQAEATLQGGKEEKPWFG